MFSPAYDQAICVFLFLLLSSTCFLALLAQTNLPGNYFRVSFTTVSRKRHQAVVTVRWVFYNSSHDKRYVLLTMNETGKIGNVLLILLQSRC